MNDLFKDADVIFTYTRADAIADGVLIDVTETAREAGFRPAVAISHAAYEQFCAWNDEDDARKPTGTGQSTEGRLWDVLWMARCGASNAEPGAMSFEYQFLCVPREGEEIEPREETLKCVIGPGDNHEPVITIMLPHED